MLGNLGEDARGPGFPLVALRSLAMQASIEHSDFEFRIRFGFRDSNFEFVECVRSRAHQRPQITRAPLNGRLNGHDAGECLMDRNVTLITDFV